MHALREATDLIVQLSTGGAVTDRFDQRLAVLDAAPGRLLADLRHRQLRRRRVHEPVAVHDGAVRQDAGSYGVVPEFELFDLGHIAALHRLLAELGPPAGGHVHCDLVMGVPGGMPGDAATLVAGGLRAAGRGDLVGDRHRPDLRCRCCSPRWRPAATCGSAWRTP